MPKPSNEDVVNYIVSRDKNTRQTLALLKKQLSHFDIESDRMNTEFNERQAMHLQFIEDDKRHHAQRLANHEKKKADFALIVMKLEGEIAEDLDLDESTGAVVALPQLPAPEVRRPRPRKPTIVERLTGKKARA